MPEYLRALAVILITAAVFFALARRPICEVAVSESNFLRWRNLWFGVTLLAFLAHSIWVFAICTAVLVYLTGRRDPNPLAIFAVLLFCIPRNISAPIPGIGPIDTIFDLTHSRILSISLLLPVAIALHSSRSNRMETSRLPDLAVAAYILLSLAIDGASVDSPTITVPRLAFYRLIDIWLPYYVASRGIRELSQLKEVLGIFVVVAALIGIFALFEAIRNWNLFQTLPSLLGGGYVNNLYRAGTLRAQVTVGHANGLGFFLANALVFCLFFALQARASGRLWIATGCITGGLVATLSRGPWLGAGVMLACFWALSPNKGAKFRALLLIVAALCLAMVFLPSSVLESIKSFLPFVGTVEPGSVTYRTRLIDVSMEVFWQNPLFGDPRFLANPLMEQMRQGQGLIDITNGYLQVALAYGGFGLLLFVTALSSPYLSLLRARKHHISLNNGPEIESLGRVLFAAFSGSMLIIGTTSRAPPEMYWMLTGLAASYGRMYVDNARGAKRIRQRVVRKLPNVRPKASVS